MAGCGKNSRGASRRALAHDHGRDRGVVARAVGQELATHNYLDYRSLNDLLPYGLPQLERSPAVPHVRPCASAVLVWGAIAIQQRTSECGVFSTRPITEAPGVRPALGCVERTGAQRLRQVEFGRGEERRARGFGLERRSSRLTPSGVAKRVARRGKVCSPDAPRRLARLLTSRSAGCSRRGPAHDDDSI
jgi:hypothetical protein